MGPAGVLRYVAADGAGLLARRVGGVVEAVLAYRCAQVQVHQPRLHNGDEVLGVNLQDPLQPSHGQKDAAGRGEGSATYAGASAPGHDGYALPVSDLDGPGHLLGGAGNDHDLRVARRLGAVVFEDYQVLRGVEDVPLPHHLGKLIYDLLRDHVSYSIRLCRLCGTKGSALLIILPLDVSLGHGRGKQRHQRVVNDSQTPKSPETFCQGLPSWSFQEIGTAFLVKVQANRRTISSPTAGSALRKYLFFLSRF